MTRLSERPGETVPRGPAGPFPGSIVWLLPAGALEALAWRHFDGFKR
jgi:hypothetical protein